MLNEAGVKKLMRLYINAEDTIIGEFSSSDAAYEELQKKVKELCQEIGLDYSEFERSCSNPWW